MNKHGDDAIASVDEVVAELRAGRMVVLVDDPDRENEGDLVLAADAVTPEAINFMARFARGLICLTLRQEHCERLGLKPMVHQNGTAFGTNFTVSIEAAQGVTTGISAADRAHTIRVAVAAGAKPSDLVQPGHVFPLAAVPGGVLMRAGHTEAGCDLAELAGRAPAAVICEIMNDDGTMARLPDLQVFARQHGMKIGTIADLIRYRAAHDSMVDEIGRRRLQTAEGEFVAVLFQDRPTKSQHLALVHAPAALEHAPCSSDQRLLMDQQSSELSSLLDPERVALVRVHEPTSLLDMLAVDGLDHAYSPAVALQRIKASEQGVAVFLNLDHGAGQFGAWFGQQVAASSAHHRPVDSPGHWMADLRTYGVGAQILRHVGVRHMRLLSRPRKMPSMQGFGLTVLGFDGDL